MAKRRYKKRGLGHGALDTCAEAIRLYTSCVDRVKRGSCYTAAMDLLDGKNEELLCSRRGAGVVEAHRAAYRTFSARCGRA